MNDRIKVLYLISSLSVGGAERFVLALAGRIDRTRFEVHVCSLGVVRGNALQPYFEQLGVPVTIVGAKRFTDPKALLSVLRYVRKHQIDIIHTQTLFADVLGSLVGRLLGRPVISTLQNEPRDYNCQRFDQRWLMWITTRFFATRLVAVSQRIRTMFIDEWHIRAERILTIYNAVPMEQYLSIPGVAARSKHQAEPVITTIGRLSPQKAHHDLLTAAKCVLMEYPNAHFMIVGQGRLADQLNAQAQALGISDRVTFTGLRHDIPQVLAESDIFVLSSLWEGLPLTAVEAMAAARPVVLTDVGGNRELVEAGRQGLIVPPGDPPALARALVQLLNDEAMRHRMGLAGRARVHHDFSIATIAAQHEALYTSLLPSRLTVSNRSNISIKS